MVDRTTRWPEAVPLVGITPEECIRAFLLTWVVCFGLPLHLTSDCGRQFTSSIWTELASSLGSTIHQHHSLPPPIKQPSGKVSLLSEVGPPSPPCRGPLGGSLTISDAVFENDPQRRPWRVSGLTDSPSLTLASWRCDLPHSPT